MTDDGLWLKHAKTLPVRTPESTLEEPIEIPELEATREGGELIGRYIVLARLGAGTMGEVYAAYDPELDRKIALKLLRRREDDVEDARRRMQREAQSLAKLDHPNVVTVYDVGVVEGQLFIAMEFVEGQTLAEWLELSDEPQPWPAVLDAFMAAGRGLAAAHAVGLVHRDFKPENVMIGRDGRVRVMDFGLARGDGWTREDEERGREWLRMPVDKLTMTGTMMGTPAYMSLEQFESREVTARSDQFGFCVALYEGLYGERPFAGSTLVDLLDAIEREKVRPTPAGAKVPAWLRELLLRGMARSPSDRFESMDELLELLADDPLARRRQWITRTLGAAAITATVIGLGVLGVTVAEQRAQIAADQHALQLQNEQLRGQREQLLLREQQLESELSAQKGMRASMLANTSSNELEALRTAVEAVGALEPGSPLAPPVLAGLIHATTNASQGLTLEGHEAELTAVAHTPDGTRIVTASADRSVRVWDRSGALLQTLTGHTDRIHALSVSPSGGRLAAAGADGRVRVWSLPSGAFELELELPSAVYDLDFSPDGARLATAGRDARVRVWLLETRTQLLELTHADAVAAVAWDPEGERLASASFDGHAQVWSAGTGTPQASFDGHGGHKLHALAWSPAGRRLVTGGEDGAARLWDASSGEPLGVFDHGEAVRALAFSPDGAYLASGTFNDDAGHLWQVASRERVRSFAHAGPVTAVAWAPDGRSLTTASWDTTARSWTLTASPALHELDGHRGGVYTVASSPDGARIATGGADDVARLWDARSGDVLAELRGHTHDLSAARFSSDGTLLATAAWDGTVRLWDGRSGAFMRTLRGHEGRLQALAFAPSTAPSTAHGDVHLASAGADGTVRIWNATSGELLHTLAHQSGVVDLSFSSGGERLLAVTAVNTGHLWSARSGEALEFAFVGPVSAAAFAPSTAGGAAEGELLALATKGNEVQLWDPGSERVRGRLRGHAAPVTRISWTTDGATLATASADGSARLWRADGGELGSLTHPSPVHDLAFAADGQRVLTASGDAGARSWSLAPHLWLAWACAMLDAREAHTPSTQTRCAEVSREGVGIPDPLARAGIIEGEVTRDDTLTRHGVEFVRVPAGAFSMGSPAGVGDDNERPQHELQLDSFYIARTELTNAQYARYLDANPQLEPPAGWAAQHDGRYDQPEQPVTFLSWHDAKAYCDWAGFELPTEAQWEYAARGGTTTAYWYGDETYELTRFGWFVDNSGDRPHAVAHKGANAFGLHDMAGNVWEWTLDAKAGYEVPARAGDGLRAAPRGEASRVIRGGSWYHSAGQARSGVRLGFAPTLRFKNIGFRPVLPQP